MVTFAELKAKAEKAKDASVTKVTNTRDRLSSVPSSKTHWDPNWKRAPPPPATGSSTRGPPPPPLRSRPDGAAGSAPPVAPRASRPSDDVPAPRFSPPPPPTRVASGYPPSHSESVPDTANKIDWAHLSPEDKAVFFGWLDEFFSRHLNIVLGERRSMPPPSVPAALPVHRPVNTRPPPTINMATRPSA